MIGHAHRFRYLFYNAQRSFQDLTNILETRQQTHDIIFIQEQPFCADLRKQRSSTNPNGDPVSGAPHHPAWVCIDGKEVYNKHTSQVGCYVHTRVTSAFHLAVDSVSFCDANIICFSLTDLISGFRESFVNVYRHPTNRSTLTNLFNGLLQIKDIAIVQGDFNAHSSFWDRTVIKDDKISVDIIEHLHAAGLTCVNDLDTPTWYRKNNSPRVLDLVWVNDRVLQDARFNCYFDVKGPHIDHRQVLLQFVTHKEPPVFLRPPYIPKESTAELNFLSELERHQLHSGSS